MNTRIHSSRGNQGGILLTALVIGGVLGVALLATLSLSSFHNQTTVRSSVWNNALVVAEAGVEEALAQLGQTSGTWAANGWTLSGGQYFKRRSLGTDWYLVMVTTDPTEPVIVSTASVFLPANSNRIARTVRVNTRMQFSGMRGMLAKGKVLVSGSVSTDSYDSSNPTYSTRGLYDVSKASDKGAIGTTSIEPEAVELAGSSQINGKIGSGTSEGLTIKAPSSVGSFAWTADAANAGKVEPGWHTTDMTSSVTNIIFPTAAGTLMPGIGRVGGVAYAYVLGNDRYWLGNLVLSGKQVVMVTGNATLIIDDTLDITGTAGFQIAPGAKLTLYVRKSASIGGNGIVNRTGNATNFTYYGGPENYQINYSGTADFLGTVYAPSAKMTLTGASQFFGASVSDEIVITGNFKYHYDEALAGRALKFAVTGWDEI